MEDLNKMSSSARQLANICHAIIYGSISSIFVYYLCPAFKFMQIFKNCNGAQSQIKMEIKPPPIIPDSQLFSMDSLIGQQRNPCQKR